jgi:hypothetical protein
MSMNLFDDHHRAPPVGNGDRRVPPQAEVLAIMERMEREIEACEQSRKDQAEMIKAAVREGVAQALAGLGLNDEKAAADVRDLRQLMSDWRTVRLSAMQMIGKALGFAILGVLAGWMASQKWGG